MTIKIGTGSGAVEPSALRMGSGPAKRVMVGTGNDAVPVWVYQAPPMEPLSFGGGRTAHPGYAKTGTLVTFYVEHGGRAHVHVKIDGPSVDYHWGEYLNRYFGIMNPEFLALRYWDGPNPPDTPWIVDEITGPVRFQDNTEYTIYLRIDADEPMERYLNSWSVDIIPVVPAVDTSTILTVSPTEAAWGDPVTLTATVTPSNAVGSVTFDGAGETSTVSLVDGVATTTRTFYTPGEYEVSAEFTPTSEEDFLPSSGTSSITVVEGAPQVVVIDAPGYNAARNQFRDALTARGLDYATVETLPFALDTSQATNLEGLFSFCSELTEVPDLDTSNVTRMSNMFAHCSSLTEVPAMDTSNVTEMNNMFSGCSSLTEVPEMDTSNVTNMNGMFNDCSSLASVPEMDTSNVTNMGAMFSNTKLTSVPEMDTSQVTNMFSMYAFNSSLVEVPEMDTSNVTNMGYMFAWCTALTYVPDMDTSNVTNMASMLSGTQSLTDGNIKLFGRHPDVDTTDMIQNSGLTVEPFYVPAVETTTTLSVVPNEITEGEQVILTATVTPSEAVGEVTFTVGTQTSTVALVGGTASSTVTLDTPGAYDVTADFIPAPGSGFDPSSDTFQITVLEFIPDPVETTTTLVVVPDEIEEGESVTVTATVTPVEAEGVVEFDVAGQLSSVNVAGGVATTTATLEEAGDYDITADFTPANEADFLPSSATGTVTVVEGTPVVVIDARGYMATRDQLRDALAARGLDYQTVTTLPFALDIQVTDIQGLFSGCSSLTEVPEMDTSNVTVMGSMFDGCSSLTTVPEMDTSKNSRTDTMFSGCSSLTYVPEMDTSNVTDMSGMFRYCSSLTEVPEVDTSKVWNTGSMFNGCSQLTNAPEMDTSNVTHMSSMFSGCSALTTAPEMDTSNVTSMASMFANCSSLTYVPDMETSNVTDTSSMFRDCSALTDGNVRLFGKHPDVNTTSMISNSGLTREPFYSPLSFAQTEPQVLARGSTSTTIRDLYEVTVPENITADIILSWDWDLRGSTGSSLTRTMRLRRNGSTLDSWDQTLSSASNQNLPWTDSGTRTGQVLQAGDVLEVQAIFGYFAESGRTIKSWSIEIFPV